MRTPLIFSSALTVAVLSIAPSLLRAQNASIASGNTAATSPAPTKSSYTIARIETPKGFGIHPHALNASGHVVGELIDANGKNQAFLHANGKFQPLRALEGKLSRAFDINDRGQIVGAFVVNPKDPQQAEHAFLYNEGKFKDLGTLGGNASAALAINNSGAIVGWADSATGVLHAFLYRDGKMQDLGTFGGESSSARDINDSGQIIGTFRLRPSPNESVVHAFRYADGKMEDLGNFGGELCQPRAINASGQIVGSFGHMTQWSSDHAFLYNQGKMTDLGNFGGNAPYAVAGDINTVGQIVGTAGNQNPERSLMAGFLYDHGRLYNLVDLVGPANLAGAGLETLQVFRINDRGQILGTAEYQKREQVGILLTPVAAK